MQGGSALGCRLTLIGRTALYEVRDGLRASPDPIGPTWPYLNWLARPFSASLNGPRASLDLNEQARTFYTGRAGPIVSPHFNCPAQHFMQVRTAIRPRLTLIL